jgi:carboxynorspermidine decarboxylase
MPDVLEMPYRPRVLGAGDPGEHPHTYRLAGLTCLAGDVVGDYSFPEPLSVGQKLVFMDMAHYTMVKATTFNGVGLPAIATYDSTRKSIDVVRRFGYRDYRERLS